MKTLNSFAGATLNTIQDACQHLLDSIAKQYMQLETLLRPNQRKPKQPQQVVGQSSPTSVLGPDQEKLNVLDQEFEALNRGLFGILNVLSEFIDGLEPHSDPFELRNQLFPQGPCPNVMSYKEEAYHVARIDEQVTQEPVRQSLQGISMMYLGEKLTALQIAQRIVALSKAKASLLEQMSD